MKIASYFIFMLFNASAISAPRILQALPKRITYFIKTRKEQNSFDDAGAHTFLSCLPIDMCIG